MSIRRAAPWRICNARAAFALALPVAMLGTAFSRAASLPRSDPEVQDVDPAGVLAFLQVVGQSHLNLHSFMLVRHGHVVAEGWWKPYRPEFRHTLYSLTKSFTATAAGMAVTEGKLGLDDKVAALLAGELPPEVSSNLAAMRVRDLLTMTAGHAKDPISTLVEPPPDGNWVRAVLAQPVAHAPGTYFAYSNGSALLLSAVIQKATGRTPREFLGPRLFAPLGIAGEDWETYPDGRNIGGWGLRLKTEDLAKFGQLYLQRGNWEGRQLLPEAWIKEATSRQSPSHYGADPDFAQGYGYMFWLTRHGAYRGFGSLDEVCLVMPSQDAVLVITAENYASKVLSAAVWDHLLPALLDRRPPVTSYGAELRAKLTSLELPVPVGRDITPGRARINGRIFAMDTNVRNIAKVSLYFDGDRGVFGFWDARGYHEVVVGLGKWAEGEAGLSALNLNATPASDLPAQRVAGSGAWTSDDTFEMFWQFIETAHGERITCNFDGEALRMTVTGSIVRDKPDSRMVFTGRLLAPPSPNP